MKNLYFCLILGFVTTFASTTSFADLTCGSILGLTDLPNMIEIIDDPQGIYNGTSVVRGRSVFFNGVTKDHVSFRKISGLFWYSSENVYPQGNTAQGNPTTLIRLAGNELGRLLEFHILQKDDKSIELWVPRTALLRRKIDHINHYFEKWGLEPISYLPRGSDFVSAKEILELGSKKSGEFEFQFPFADSDVDLAVHEVSFHLGALFYPRTVLSRAREINEAYVQFLPQLLEHPELPEFLKGHQGMIHSRASELDFGTANPQISLSHYRILKKSPAPQDPEGNFAFRQNLGEKVDDGARFFDQLMHSDFKPSEVVALKLMRQFGLQNTPEFRQTAKGRVYFSPYTKAIAASPAAKEVILHSLVPILKKQAETETLPAQHAKTLFRQMADELPERLKKMQEALSLPEPPQ